MERLGADDVFHRLRPQSTDVRGLLYRPHGASLGTLHIRGFGHSVRVGKQREYLHYVQDGTAEVDLRLLIEDMK